MMDTKSSTFFRGHKTIACGRPKACETVKQQLMQKVRIKTIEVCGFSKAKAKEYVDTFFKNNPERAVKVNELIQNPKLRVMSSVPIFLWVICLLHSEDTYDFGDRTLHLRIVHFSEESFTWMLYQHRKPEFD